MPIRGWKSWNAPFLPLSLAFIVGLLAGERYSTVSWSILLLAAIVLILVIRRHEQMATLLVLVAAIAIGGLFTNLRVYPAPGSRHVVTLPTRQRCVLTGTVYKPTLRRHGNTVLFVQADAVGTPSPLRPTTGKLRVSVADTATGIRYGNRIRAHVKLYHPRNFNNPGGFDYKRYLRRMGVLVTAYVREGHDIEIIGSGGNPILRWFDRQRCRIESFLDTHTAAPGRGMVKALLIGERAEITDDIREAFIGAGAVHILAISGLHLGIIVTLSYFVFLVLLKRSERAMLYLNVRKVAAAATFVPLLGYILITGYPISTIRAAIMAAIFLLSIILDRYRNTLNTLSFAALVILVISPASLWDISFQLSFVSVLGILLITPIVQRHVFPHDPLRELQPSRWNRVARALVSAGVASVAALLVTSPLVALYFHRMSSMGLLSNLVVIPLTGFGIIPAGLLCILLIPLCAPAAAVMGKVAAALGCAGIACADAVASLPWASTYLPGPTAVEMCLFFGLIAVLLWCHRSRMKKWLIIGILVLGAVDCSYWVLTRYATNTVRVTFLDVGQGDCAVVEFPGGKTMLVDGGGLYGHFNLGKHVVAPFLWHRRIMAIDYLVLSHPDRDHYKGFRFIARHFPIGQFWYNGVESDVGTYRELVDILTQRTIPMLPVTKGFTRDVGRCTLAILHPDEDRLASPSRPRGWVNNSSLVLKLIYGNHRVLFTGDIEREVERELLHDGRDLDVDVLKVPHHGSRTSSSLPFLKMTSPTYAIMSLGYRNPFHYPHKKVVTRYQKLGTTILRTDRDGAVTVLTDGTTMTIATYLKSPEGERAHR
jgi:competence protein ComEC